MSDFLFVVPECFFSLKVPFAGNFRVKHDFSGGMVERVSRNEQFEKESSWVILNQLILPSCVHIWISRWWFQIYFYFHPYSNLANTFQMGWNQPLYIYIIYICIYFYRYVIFKTLHTYLPEIFQFINFMPSQYSKKIYHKAELWIFGRSRYIVIWIVACTSTSFFQVTFRSPKWRSRFTPERVT